MFMHKNQLTEWGDKSQQLQFSLAKQCVKDCGPCKHTPNCTSTPNCTCTPNRTCMPNYTHTPNHTIMPVLTPTLAHVVFFKIVPYFFSKFLLVITIEFTNRTCRKLIVSLFLTMKATILDTGSIDSQVKKLIMALKHKAAIYSHISDVLFRLFFRNKYLSILWQEFLFNYVESQAVPYVDSLASAFIHSFLVTVSSLYVFF